MAGVEWIWDHAEDDVERAVSLLTGIAMLTTKGDDDPIRKAVAFGGRLQMPFFEVPPPDESAALRICFVAEHQRWVLYRLDRKGMPTVRSSCARVAGRRCTSESARLLLPACWLPSSTTLTRWHGASPLAFCRQSPT